MTAHSPRLGTAAMIDRFTDACVTRAARRWPDDLYQGMSREWRAELSALRADRAVGPLARAWRAITFAASLAVSPSVESENPMPTGSRGRLPGPGQAIAAAASVIGVALLAVGLFSLASSPSEANIDEYYSNATVDVITMIWILLAVVLMGWIGTVAGRRGLAWFRGASGVSALLCTAPLGVVMWLVLALPQYSFQSIRWLDPAFAAVTWIVLSALTMTFALRLADGGRRMAGWVVGIVGSLVALDGASIAGGLRTATQVNAGYAQILGWFPLSLVPNAVVNFGHYFVPPTPSSGSPELPYYASNSLLATIGPVAGPLLLCTAFVLAYAMRAARSTTTVNGAVTAARAHPAPLTYGPLIRRIGVAGVVIGFAVLMYVTAANPQVAREGSIFNAADLVWYRLIAIMVVAMATGLALVGRGPVAVPAIVTFVVLLAADCVVSQANWSDRAAALVLPFVCAATLFGAWWLAGKLAASTSSDITFESARRTLLGIAVLGPLAIPTAINESVLTPDSLVVGMYVLGALLWLLAISAALGSRTTRLGWFATTCYVVVPLAGIVLFGSRTITSALYYPQVVFFVQAPFAVVALAAARWNEGAAPLRAPDPVRASWRRALNWVLLAVGAAAITEPVSDMLQNIGGTFANGLVYIDPVRMRTFPDIGDVNPNLAGQIVLAIALAVLVAKWVYPRRGESMPVDSVPIDPMPADPLLTDPVPLNTIVPA